MTPIKIESTPAMRRFNAAVEAADSRLAYRGDRLSVDQLLHILRLNDFDNEAAELAEAARGAGYALCDGYGWPAMPTIEPITTKLADLPDEEQTQGSFNRTV